MAALAQPVPQQTLVEEAVKSVKAPVGLTYDHSYFDTDHEGDPVVRVVFRVAKDVSLGSESISEIAAFDEDVAEAVRQSSPGPLTYVHFIDE